MADGQDSRARWKSVVLALPPDRSRVYLREVEGYGPEQIGRLLGGDDATIVPADWDVTEESREALARYDAWELSTAESSEVAAQDDYQEARGAALPPHEGSPAKFSTEEVHQ